MLSFIAFYTIDAYMSFFFIQHVWYYNGQCDWDDVMSLSSLISLMEIRQQYD